MTKSEEHLAVILAGYFRERGTPDAEQRAIGAARAICEELHGNRVWFWSSKRKKERLRQERDVRILRARQEDLTVRQIAAALDVSKSTVQRVLSRSRG